jgi:hypothetical protein
MQVAATCHTEMARQLVELCAVVSSDAQSMLWCSPTVAF